MVEIVLILGLSVSMIFKIYLGIIRSTNDLLDDFNSLY